MGTLHLLLCTMDACSTVRLGLSAQYDAKKPVVGMIIYDTALGLFPCKRNDANDSIPPDPGAAGYYQLDVLHYTVQFFQRDYNSSALLENRRVVPRL